MVSQLHGYMKGSGTARFFTFTTELEPLDQALLCSKKSPRSMYTVTQ